MTMKRFDNWVLDMSTILVAKLVQTFCLLVLLGGACTVFYTLFRLVSLALDIVTIHAIHNCLGT